MINEFNAISAAGKQAHNILDKYGYSSTAAEKEVFNRTFEDYYVRNRYIAQISATQPVGELTYIGDLKNKDPEGYKKAKEWLTKFEGAKKRIFQENIQKALADTKDARVKAAILAYENEYLHRGEYKENYSRVLAAHFGKDWESAKEAYHSADNRDEKYAKLSANGKLAHDLYNAAGRGELGDPVGSIAGEKALTAKQNEVSKTTIKGRTAGAIGFAGGVAVGLAPLTNNYLNKDHLNSCQSDLKLSDMELSFLTNTRDIRSAPKAKSPRGVFNVPCSKIALVNPEETITQIKLLNDGQIPVGVCAIMKNEDAMISQRMDDSTAEPTSLDCKTFAFPNGGLTTSSEGVVKFEYRDGDFTYRAPWNATTRSPELGNVEVVGRDKQPNTARRLEFLQRYNIIHPPNNISAPRDQMAKNRSSIDIASACTDDHKGAIDCNMAKAIVSARIYWSLKELLCADPSSAETLMAPKPDTK